MRNTPIPTESLKFTEARSKLSSLVDRVFQRQIRVRISKGNTPIAAIVSIGDLERLEQLDQERNARFEALFGLGAHFADVPADELEAQIERAIKEARAEMSDVA